MMARELGLPRCRGFTLLEMLIVIGLLSGLALMAFATVSDGENQRRFEDTANRLAAIRRAVLGNSEPVYDGQVRLSGFVADNGVLPATLAQLAAAPAGFDLRQARQAQFDQAPDAATCLNDGGESGVGDPLIKGHAGRYLPPEREVLFPLGFPSGFPVQVAPFRDGWGNVTPRSSPPVATDDDFANFGWAASLAGGTLTVTSRGLNNVVAVADTGFDADTALPINGDVDLNGWQVTIANRGTAPLLPTAGTLRVSVLAYLNSATGSKWKRVTSSQNVAQIPAGSATTVSFNGSCDNDSAGNSVVPQGRHLVVLIADSEAVGGAAHNGTTESLADADSVTSGDQILARQVAFFAGADRPTVTLEIR